MRAIRQPSFADVLEDVALTPEEGAEIDSVLAPAAQPDWLFQIFAAAAEAAVAAQSSAAAYREATGEAQPSLAPLDEEERVAMELDLANTASLDDLARIRRDFARRNHPDMLHPGLSEQATARMKIANMLIDQRARELKARRHRT
ncbi:hypothetical protein [uncultured Methylovirgula sp.]|uniref:hypothetical protein n=1 Tax=uncultured Methylovirgula sp. TaxID=1285960 RepID=UPI002618FCF8|nr:hypothetical protein [uncultured Methylovirgula sp.]